MNREEIQEDEYIFPYHHIPILGPFAEERVLFWGYEYAAYLQKILDTVAAAPFSSLVDIGCGDGRLIHELAKQYPATFVGTDFSKRALAFAHAFTPTAEFVERIPKDRSFDVVTLIEVLEHIPPERIDTFLQEVKSVMTKNGRGLITVPSTNLPLNRKHYQHFTVELAHEILDPHFKIESISYLNTQSFGQKILQRMLSNRFFTLAYQPARTFLYRMYKRRYLDSDPKKGARLLIIVRNST